MYRKSGLQDERNDFSACSPLLALKVFEQDYLSAAYFAASISPVKTGSISSDATSMASGCHWIPRPYPGPEGKERPDHSGGQYPLCTESAEWM